MEYMLGVSLILNYYFQEITSMYIDLSSIKRLSILQ